MSAFLTTALRSDMVSCSHGKQLHPSIATPLTAPHPPRGKSPLPGPLGRAARTHSMFWIARSATA